MTTKTKRNLAKVVAFGVPAVVFGACLFARGTRDEKIFMAASLSVLSAFVSVPLGMWIAPKS